MPNIQCQICIPTLTNSNKTIGLIIVENGPAVKENLVYRALFFWKILFFLLGFFFSSNVSILPLNKKFETHFLNFSYCKFSKILKTTFRSSYSRQKKIHKTRSELFVKGKIGNIGGKKKSK
jgi:hypothetical protein